jgi:ribosomal protein S18 acetylase RimI-like enzyme
MLQRLSDHDGGQYDVASEAVLTEAGWGRRPFFGAVLAEDAAPMGMAIYYPDFSTHRGEPGVYVQDIWVEPAARGAGLGRRLLAAVMAQQDWGAQYLTLGVSPDNTLAWGFYTKLGFQPRGYEVMLLAGSDLKALR